MNKVVFRFLQGSAIAQTVLSGQIIYNMYLLGAHFLYSMTARNYKNEMTVDQVVAAEFVFSRSYTV